MTSRGLPIQTSASFFSRLLEFLEASGHGSIAVLEAYFDESERTRGTFVFRSSG